MTLLIPRCESDSERAPLDGTDAAPAAVDVDCALCQCRTDCAPHRCPPGTCLCDFRGRFPRSCGYSAPECSEGREDGTCDIACMFDPDCISLGDADLAALGYAFDAGESGCNRSPRCDPARDFRTLSSAASSADTFTYNGKTAIRPCPNDPDCAGGTVFPCRLDGHCDPCCPCNLDPDCFGCEDVVFGVTCGPLLTCPQV